VFISCHSQPDRISLHTSIKVAMKDDLTNQLIEDQY